MTEKKQNISAERDSMAKPQSEAGGEVRPSLYQKVEVPKRRGEQLRPKNRPNNAPEQKDDGQVKQDTKAAQPQHSVRRKRQPKKNTAALKTQPVSEELKAPVQKPVHEKQKQGPSKRENGHSGKSGRKNSQKPAIRAYFLGGLNEIGKNFTLFECQDDMIIVDCGMSFPDGDMLGVDLVIPDFTFVERNVDKIRGVVLTHGHEDHIGALPYLLKKFNFPIYGTKFTLALVDSKLKEHGLQGKIRAVSVRPGDHIRLGCMDVEFIHVNHSVPDAVALAIHSPAGTLVHTGDFKIDCTPAMGEMIDLGRFGQLGKEGVLAMFCDSTNAEREGYTKSESKVDDSFDRLFKRAESSRIIIATFASNVSRVQQIINCAVKYGRKVALSGRSMVNVMTIGVEMGYLEVPKGVLIDIDMINRYPKEKIVLVTTGSQGEPMSALTRMAFADHRKVEVGPGDFIIISARPIPGNEKTIGNVIDELMKRGCEVVYESMYDVHVSGHACQEELKLLQAIVKPKYFIPVHGEQKHLRKNAKLAYDLGKDPKDVFIGDIGDVVELHEDYMKRLPSVPAGRILVDGLGVGDVGSIVLRDRKHLAEDGLIIAVCTISAQDGHIISGPDVVSRGFVYVRESEPLMEEARNLVSTVLENCADNNIHDWGTLKTKIKDELSRLLYDRTRRSPMVLPIIMEI
ncbi:MAG TPA: ribonuclease J [Caproicibacter sp.]|nr:ribonuclease J [Caproicibacter sp.]